MKDLKSFKILLLSTLLIPCAYGMKKREEKKKNITLNVYHNAKDIHYLAANGNLKGVKLLLLDINTANLETQTDFKETPLHLAAGHGHIHVVAYLLSQGANIEAKNKNNETPLHVAIEADQTEVVRLLVKSGANIHAKTKIVKNVKNCESNTFEWQPFGNTDPVEPIITYKKEIESNLLIHIAAQNSSAEIIKILLDSFEKTHKSLHKFIAYIEQINSCGSTPLCIASCEGHEEVVKILVAYGANLETKTKKTKQEKCRCGSDCSGETPLILAALKGHANIVSFLLRKNADVHAKDDSGNTALHFACENGDTKIVKILLQYKANIEAKTKNGETPLHLSKNAETTQLLLENGADITMKNDLEENPLHAAMFSNNSQNIKTLLKYGANIEEKSKCSETPIILAADTNKKKSLELLLKYGADFKDKVVTYTDEGDYHPYKNYIEIKDDANNHHTIEIQDVETFLTLRKQQTYKKHFIELVNRYQKNIGNQESTLRYIKKLMLSDKVPTVVKKRALALLIRNCRRNELEIFFAHASFDTEFLTNELYKGAVKYAIQNNLTDINGRTILDAVIVLNLPEIIPMVIEQNASIYSSDICKAFLYLLINGTFNPEYPITNNLIKILRNVKINNPQYKHLRKTLKNSLRFLHDLKKILPKELAAYILGFYYEEDQEPQDCNEKDDHDSDSDSDDDDNEICDDCCCKLNFDN